MALKCEVRGKWSMGSSPLSSGVTAHLVLRYCGTKIYHKRQLKIIREIAHSVTYYQRALFMTLRNDVGVKRVTSNFGSSIETFPLFLKAERLI